MGKLIGALSLSLFLMIVNTQKTFSYFNDVETNLVVMGTPQFCKMSTWDVPAESNITFICKSVPKKGDIFEFNGETPYFPYFIQPMCFVGEYAGSYQNISSCILVSGR